LLPSGANLNDGREDLLESDSPPQFRLGLALLARWGALPIPAATATAPRLKTGLGWVRCGLGWISRSQPGRKLELNFWRSKGKVQG
jgi:hypothetical protein